MGAVFQYTEPYLGDTSGTMFLEIGSDRYEGSTRFFHDLSHSRKAEFHTVDLKPDAKRRLALECPRARWHFKEGSKWCYEDLPELNKSISLVYLDNFDYIWDTNAPPRDHDLHIYDWYEQNYTKLDNQDCQIEHLRQMIAIYPYLTHDAVVCFDDTYTVNGCWVGKCGPAVVYLLTKGFEIKRAEKFECGVILKRL
jgi:hypothetical protein